MAKSIVLTADGTVHTIAQAGRLVSVHLAAGADAATAKVYDAASAAAPQIASLSAVLTGNDEFRPSKPIDYSINLYVVMTGTNEEVTLVYD